MTPGALVRKLAGPYERRLCELYRGIFVDVDRCIRQIATAIPPLARVIDIGGGDGQVLNLLLRLRPDITVAMLDLRASIGLFLEDDLRERVELNPSTSLALYRERGKPLADALLVSDVIHHVPRPERPGFVRDCRALMNPDAVLVIKDYAPGHLRSVLALATDWFVTGDRHVRLLTPAEMAALVESHTDLCRQSSLLATRELPNYAMAFRRHGAKTDPGQTGY